MPIGGSLRSNELNILVTLLGITLLLLTAVACSCNRRAINLRTVGGAFLLQASIPALVIFTRSGADMLRGIAGVVQVVIDSAEAGISFLFGGNLERMGDHSTAVAEQIYYAATGSVPEDDRPKSDQTSQLLG